MSDELLNLIHQDVKEIKEAVAEIKTNQAVMQLDVKHHVKRSDMLEDLVTHLDETKISPLQADMNQIKGIYKFVMFLSLLATIALAFIEWFKH